MLYNFYNLEISKSEGIYLPKDSCSPSFGLCYQALKHSLSILNILESYLLQIRYTRSLWLSRIKRSFIVDHGKNVTMAQYIFNCLSEAIFQETSSEID